jgi:hypothetical protein
MVSEGRAAGSRMHMLDWLEGGKFIADINGLLQPTELFVPQSGKRMPRGWDSTDEARLGKGCGALIDDNLNAILLNWWLANPARANVPNWDLACEALYHGDKPAIVLVEAKAYVREFTDGSGGGGAKDGDNKKRIAEAIEEACVGLSVHAPGVNISANHWYQFSNRIAFAWKLASQGVPTVLIYLGFLGDKGIGTDALRDHDHWKKTVLDNTRDVFPASAWEHHIDVAGTPLWLLIRSLVCARQSAISSRRKLSAIQRPQADGQRKRPM